MRKSGQSFAIEVAAAEEGMRLDHLLVQRVEGQSRSALLKSIRSGSVLVDDHQRKAGYRVRQGEQISVELPPPEPSAMVAEEVPFPIIYEDTHILVLSKPPGLVVHPAAGHREKTLAHGLLHHCTVLPGTDDHRPGIVHRLDKDTSGIMLAAKTDRALQQMTRDFSDRKISKIYHAILLRSPREDQGRIEAPIGRHPVRRKKMAVRRDGRFAATGWTLAERFANGMCLAEISLETGRTHQIRVHMADMGCPVAGDELYGGRVPREWSLPVFRQLLHASTLTFQHPVSGKHLVFDAPLWDDMAAVLQLLRAAPTGRVS
jgi:23S rRNA pseudouridine1911/1915/1917 synthase